MPAGGWASTTGSPLSPTAELTASDGVASPGGMQPGDNFGDAVALSGATIAVGAEAHTVGTNVYQGAAYAFHALVTSQTVSLSLSPPTIAANGTASSTATFTADDTSGVAVSGDAVSITSSGGQTVGPVTAGATPGTYQATITSTTTAGTATITATDTSVAPNATATASLVQNASAGRTLGEPSNVFRIDSYTHHENGTITLTLGLPGPGSVSVLGTHSDPTLTAGTASALLEPGYHRLAWTRHGTTATRGGRMRVTLHPNKAGRRMPNYARGQGWALHVRVWVTYTPTGGKARERRVTIRVLSARTA
jgi:adhesin/invasin